MTCLDAYVSHYPGNASLVATVFVIVVIVTKFYYKRTKEKWLYTN